MNQTNLQILKWIANISMILVIIFQIAVGILYIKRRNPKMAGFFFLLALVFGLLILSINR